MKTLILSAAAALALSAPAFADTADFVRAHFAQDQGTSERVQVVDGPAAGNAAIVIEHFAQDYETGDGPRVLVPEVTGMVLSTSNSDLASFVESHLDDEDTSFLN